MSYVRHQLGSLDCIIKSGVRQNRAVVLFHGYGAGADDLAPFGQVIRLEHDPLWVFPEGPLKVPIGPGFHGRAWFPIDVVALEHAMATGVPREFRNLHPEGLAAAAEMARSTLAAMNLDLENIVLGGFSQGAMLATELALTLPKPPRALCILSGIQLDSKRWQKLAVERSGMRFLQSHGSHDQILDPTQGRELYDMLKTAGWTGEFISFNGGHEIPELVLSKLISFLNGVFA